jgi:monovalent cation:H+ antiporter-2, CPA2 family
MTGIALLLAGAAVGFALARWLRLPVIPLLLLVGAVLGAFDLLPEEQLEPAVVLGVTFLLFAAGLELNPRRMAGWGRAAVQVGIWQFAWLGLAGLGAALALGFGVHTALYLALALAASSTLVVVRLLRERQQTFEPYGRLVIGVLLLQDLLVILMMPVLIGLPDGPRAVALGLGAALGLMALAYACVRWVTPWLVLRLDLDEESLLIAVLALLFVFLGLAHALELPLVAGAFLAGVALSPAPVSDLVRGQLSSLSDFFLALLFIALGGLLVLPTPTELLQALALALLVVVATPPLVTVVAERAGLSARAGIEAGLLLSQTSELSLIVALQGLMLGHVEAGVFTIVALVTVLTMILTPFLATDQVTAALMRLHPLRRRRPPESPPTDHVLLLGCGEHGMLVLESLLLFGHSVLVVDDDPAVVERIQQAGVPCSRGDGADIAVLLQAGAPRAKVIVSTLRRTADSEAVLRLAPGVPALVRVFDPEEGERIRRLGGHPIVVSEAAVQDFVGWLEGWLAAGPEAEAGPSLLGPESSRGAAARVRSRSPSTP